MVGELDLIIILLVKKNELEHKVQGFDFLFSDAWDFQNALDLTLTVGLNMALNSPQQTKSNNSSSNNLKFKIIKKKMTQTLNLSSYMFVKF